MVHIRLEERGLGVPCHFGFLETFLETVVDDPGNHLYCYWVKTGLEENPWNFDSGAGKNFVVGNDYWETVSVDSDHHLKVYLDICSWEWAGDIPDPCQGGLGLWRQNTLGYPLQEKGSGLY